MNIKMSETCVCTYLNNITMSHGELNEYGGGLIELKSYYNVT